MGKRIVLGLASSLLVLLAAALAPAQEATVRYYVSEVLPPDADKDYYRLALSDAIPRPNFSAVIPTHPVTGIPLFAWGIAYVQATDYSGVDADPRNFRLFQGEEADQPDLAPLLARLDAVRWADVPVAKRTAIRDTLIQLGVPTKDISGTTSLRAILQKVGQHLQPGFNEANLYVR